MRDLLSVDQRAELDAIEDQAHLATGLYVATSVLTLGGLATLFGGSIGTLVCGPPDDCSGADIAIGVGGASAAAGLIMFIVATFVDQGSGERRRRLLRESLALSAAPISGGAELLLVGHF